MNRVGNILAHLHVSTQSLNSEILANVLEFVYCSRDSVDSVCLVTRQLDTLKALVTNLPNEVTEADTNRYAVDLGSINTNNVKLYVASKNPGEVLLGFQCSNDGEILQKKIYKRKDQGVLLDRFNPDGSVISQNEEEMSCNSSDWTGNQSLLQNVLSLVQSENLTVNFLKRTASNQSYMRVR